MFTVAEGVRDLGGGVLDIERAGITADEMGAFPGAITGLVLVVSVSVPWHRREPAPVFKVRLLDADRRPVGPDPLSIATGPGGGHLPDERIGTEIALPYAVPLTGYPIPAPGVYYFHLYVGDELLTVMPFRFD